MRIGVLSLIGAACLALASAVDAKPRTPSTKFYVNVHGDIYGTPTGDVYLTFNTPVQVPKATLAPGRYLFQWVSPNVVRVMSPDRRKSYAMFFVQTAMRTERRGGDVDYPQIRFDRGNGLEPLRIVGIYSEGAWYGLEPQYPRHHVAPEFRVAQK